MSNFELKALGISANGIAVYAHPEGHSHRPDLAKEAISKVTLPEDNTFFRETVDKGVTPLFLFKGLIVRPMQ